MKDKIKTVLHIANYAAIYGGNFIESLENLSDELMKKNIHTIYMFPAKKTEGTELPWITNIKERGREVYGLTESVIKAAKTIRSLIKKYDIVLIHTHFISMKQYLSVYLATMFTKCNLIMHFHNHSLVAQGVKNILRRTLYKKCTMVSCSDSVLESISRDYPKNKKFSVDNGIFFQRLENVPVATRNEYGLKKDTKICLIFGFDFYRKGVDLALRALDKLNQNGIRYELLISLSKNLESVERETIKVLGCLPSWVHIIKARSDVAALYNLCDIFLSPSREEGLPYSVLEAAYCRCNVIYSDIPAQVNLKIPYALVHIAEDFRSLAETIEKMELQGDWKKDNYSIVQEKMKENYSLSRWTSQIVDIYQKEGLKIDE